MEKRIRKNLETKSKAMAELIFTYGLTKGYKVYTMMMETCSKTSEVSKDLVMARAGGVSTE